MEFQPLRFINEPIEVEFVTSPQIQKKPVCPKSFFWRGYTFIIDEVISEWHDYNRHGRMARNMRLHHAMVASKRGSWGVGTFYFRISTRENRFFEIFYDRAPKDVDDRKGNWYLFREISPLPSYDDP